MKEIDIVKIKNDLQLQFDKFADKLEPIYQVLNWEWASCGVPKKADIVRCLNELLDDVKEVDLSQDYPMSQIGTGGLYVGYEVQKRNGMIDYIELILKFEIKEGLGDEASSYMKEKT